MLFWNGYKGRTLHSLFRFGDVKKKLDFTNVKAKQISFAGQYGDNEKQLNKILKAQTDAPKPFHISQIIPIDDRGNDYFWIFYHGEFPEKKVWEEK